MTLIVTGCGFPAGWDENITMALADNPGFAWLVAVMETDGCGEVVPGAVYRPAALIVPTPVGLMDQLTAVFVVFVTLAVNCCV